MPEVPQWLAWFMLILGCITYSAGMAFLARATAAFREASKAHGEAADFYRAAQLVARGEIAPDDLKPEARH